MSFSGNQHDESGKALAAAREHLSAMPPPEKHVLLYIIDLMCQLKSRQEAKGGIPILWPSVQLWVRDLFRVYHEPHEQHNATAAVTATRIMGFDMSDTSTATRLAHVVLAFLGENLEDLLDILLRPPDIVDSGDPNKLFHPSQTVSREWMSMILEDREKSEQIKKYRENGAVLFLNQLQSLVDELREDEPESSFLLHCERFLIKVSAATNELPDSLFIYGVAKTSEYAVNGGGFADIYGGDYRGKQVALKVPRVFGSCEGNEKILKHICREALFWRQFSHPNIIPLYGISKDAIPGKLALVSPWQKNGHLLEYLEIAPHANRTQILLEVAQGLAYLHRNHRLGSHVHADVRATNILINNNGHACLTDFGLASVGDSLGWTNSTTNNSGSVRWMAPELFVINDNSQKGGHSRSGRPQPPSDVWSFGCLCLEIFTMHQPFDNIPNEATVIHKIGKGERPMTERPAETVAPLPEEVWHIMQACWNMKAEDRPLMSDILKRLKRMPEVTAQEGPELNPNMYDDDSYSIASRSTLDGLEPENGDSTTHADSQAKDESGSISPVPGSARPLPVNLPHVLIGEDTRLGGSSQRDA